jgi:hypothetical protein
MIKKEKRNWSFAINTLEIKPTKGVQGGLVGDNTNKG